MKITLPLLLTLFLSSDAKQEEDTRDTFQFACHYAHTYYSVSCDNLSPPIVVISQVVPIFYRGAYVPGEPYVFINPLYSFVSQRSIIVHETIHYILNQKQADVTNCESEDAARRVQCAWLNEPCNDDWRARYDCE